MHVPDQTLAQRARVRLTCDHDCMYIGSDLAFVFDSGCVG